MSEWKGHGMRASVQVTQLRLPWSQRGIVEPGGYFWFQPHSVYKDFYPRTVRSVRRETLFSSDDLVLEGVTYETQHWTVQVVGLGELLYEVWGLWQNREPLDLIAGLKPKEMVITDARGNVVDPRGDFRDCMNHKIWVKV